LRLELRHFTPKQLDAFAKRHGNTGAVDPVPVERPIASGRRVNNALMSP
jgi:hypothetical protein